MPGINQVAQLAGVSTATVSRALSGNGHVSESTRHRVRAAALELGYVVSSNASSLATGRTRNIGVVIPFLNRWYFGAVLEGAQQALLNHGYDLTLYNIGGGDDQRKSVFEDFLLRKRVDAVIAISLELTGDEVERLLAMNKPIVGVGGSIAGVRTLSIDDGAVAQLATEHLLALGHRTIAFIGGNRESEMDFKVPSQAPRRFRRGAGRVRHRRRSRAVPGRGLHHPGRIRRRQAAAGQPAQATDGAVRGIR